VVWWAVVGERSGDEWEKQLFFKNTKNKNKNEEDMRYEDS
jgi:hypothetical protein